MHWAFGVNIVLDQISMNALCCYHIQNIHCWAIFGTLLSFSGVDACTAHRQENAFFLFNILAKSFFGQLLESQVWVHIMTSPADKKVQVFVFCQTPPGGQSWD